MPSIRLAMLGAGSLVGVGAWVTVGWLGAGGVSSYVAGGGVGPAPGVAAAGGWAGWIGVDVLATSGSGLGAAGIGRPLAGSLGVVAAGSSFSGCTGTAPGAMRL